MSKLNEEYKAKKNEINSQLAIILKSINKDPEKLNWGHLGNLLHVSNNLNNIMQFIGCK